MDPTLLSSVARDLQRALAARVKGQDTVIRQVLVTLMCHGHGLIVGAPGVAKTLLVRSLAGLLGLGWKRIQFTPDLTPFDILGGEVLRSGASGQATLAFSQGPIFTPFLLADEINRASPRTQAALLEAMQERQVTVAGEVHPLPYPFFVFATQNPIENEGTFPLPEAQLDRFLINIKMGYPSFESELTIIDLPPMPADPSPLSGASVLFSPESREQLRSHPLKPGVTEGIVRLVRSTRGQESSLEFVKRYVDYGAGPRACQALLSSARAFAVLDDGAKPVTLDHAFEMAKPVLTHRLVLNHKAYADKVSAEDVVNHVIEECLL